MDHGFEVFLPLVQTKRASATVVQFPYFFVQHRRSLAGDQHMSRRSPAWSGSAIAGECPTMKSTALKAMIDGHGYVSLPEGRGAPARRKIAIGAKVRITAGPFGGMSGLYAGHRRGSASSSCSIFSAGNVRCRSPPVWSRQHDAGDARCRRRAPIGVIDPVGVARREEGAHRSSSRAPGGGLGCDRRSGGAHTIGDRRPAAAAGRSRRGREG